MKRVFSFLLCITLLLSTVVLFASCGKANINVSEYTVVYANDASAHMQNAAKSLASLLKSKFGGAGNTERVKIDDAQVKSDAKEILIGNTNRPESTAALDALDGYGYSITVKGDKIVIVGTTNVLTKVALDLFVNTYLSATSESEIEMDKKTVVEDVPMIELDKNLVFVYQNGLDDVPDTGGQWDLASPQNPDHYDYPVVVAHSAAEKLASKIDISASNIHVENDKLTFNKELLVGVTDREDSIAFNATLDVDEYGIKVQNNHIMLGANNDTALASAFSLFEQLLNDGAVSEEGKTRVLLPADFTTAASNETAFVTDFPRPEAENIILTDAMDVGDSSMLYCYTGSGVSKTSFDAYCATLEADGYTKYMYNSIEGSEYVTYLHQTKKQTLHVIYAAYKYASAEGIRTVTKAIRVVSAPMTKNTVLPEEIVTQNLDYDRPANVTSNVIAVNHNWIPFDLEAENRGYGNTYIVTLEDGSFVVIDSGFVNTVDYARFPAILKQLHREITGSPASVDNPVRIAAWYLTHDHGDHYQTFYRLLQEFGTTGEFIFEYLIGNFPSDTECYNSDQLVMAKKLQHLENQIDTFQYVKVHTGQTFYLANAKFEVLCTHEDLYPTRYSGLNDTTTAIKMTLYRTDDQKQLIEDSATSVLWLGDQSHQQSDVMVAGFGNYIQSDMVQMSHHAGAGSTFAVYDLCAPRIVLVPQSRLYYIEHINDTAGQGWRGWSCTYRVVNEIESVEYIIINDDYSTVMTITENGVNMEKKDSNNPTGIYSIYDTSKSPQWCTDVINPQTSWIRKIP